MLRVCLHGFYGMGNLGDEAILVSFLKEIEGKGLNVTVLSRNPAAVRRSHHLKSVPTRGRLSGPRVRSALKKASLYLLGGGGLLKDYGSDHTSLKGWLEPLRTAKGLGTKTALFSVGVENIRYEESKRLLRKELSNVDLITVRDLSSKKLLNSLGVRSEVEILPDPAVLLGEGRSRSLVKDASPRVAVCLRHWFSQGNYVKDEKANERFMDATAEGLDHLREKYDAKIDFIPFRNGSPDNDVVIAEEVSSRMKNRPGNMVMATPPTVMEYMDMLEGCDLVIGMRLHSLILAQANGVPGVALSYMPKVRAYMEEMKQKDFCVDLENINGKSLIDMIDQTMARYEMRSKHICRRNKELKERVKKGISKLTDLARKGERRAC